MTDSLDNVVNLQCAWFHGCVRKANGVVAHPVLGWVPTCADCATMLDLELVRAAFVDLDLPERIIVGIGLVDGRLLRPISATEVIESIPVTVDTPYRLCRVCGEAVLHAEGCPASGDPTCLLSPVTADDEVGR